MFAIWWDDMVLADDTGETEQMFTNAVLTEEVNAAGKLVFTLPPEHKKRFAPTVLGGAIRVFKWGEEYWRGRVVQIDIDYYGSRTYTCEGALAFLGDVYVVMYNEAAYEDVTLKALLRGCNSKLSTWYELRSDIDHVFDARTYEADKIVPVNLLKILKKEAELGTIVTVRADKIRLGELGLCTQSCVIGKNISNAKINIDASNVITGYQVYGTYTPVGAASQPVYATISHDNAGVYGLVEELYNYGDYGNTAAQWAAKVKSDVAVPDSKATADLTITAEAFDMSVKYDDVEPFDVGKRAHVVIPTMDIDEDMLIAGIRTNLNSPEKSRITLGSTRKLLSNRLEVRYG